MLTGIKDLTIGLGGPLLLATGATLVRTAQHGWKGFSRFLAELSLAVFVSVIIHWALEAYGVAPTLMAAIEGSCGFFSGVIMEALRKRLVHEIMNRGAAQKQG